MIPLSIRFSNIEEERTDITISFVAAIRVAVNTEEPVTPVAQQKKKIVIREADIVLVSVHARHVRITPHTFRNIPALTM